MMRYELVLDRRPGHLLEPGECILPDFELPSQQAIDCLLGLRVVAGGSYDACEAARRLMLVDAA